ncbi:MAG: hypothetical protein ACOYMA_22490 [Bacteroidia bacterium]
MQELSCFAVFATPNLPDGRQARELNYKFNPARCFFWRRRSEDVVLVDNADYTPNLKIPFWAKKRKDLPEIAFIICAEWQANFPVTQ